MMTYQNMTTQYLRSRHGQIGELPRSPTWHIKPPHFTTVWWLVPRYLAMKTFIPTGNPNKINQPTKWVRNLLVLAISELFCYLERVEFPVFLWFHGWPSTFGRCGCTSWGTPQGLRKGPEMLTSTGAASSQLWGRDFIGKTMAFPWGNHWIFQNHRIFQGKPYRDISQLWSTRVSWFENRCRRS